MGSHGGIGLYFFLAGWRCVCVAKILSGSLLKLLGRSIHLSLFAFVYLLLTHTHTTGKETGTEVETGDHGQEGETETAAPRVTVTADAQGTVIAAVIAGETKRRRKRKVL